MIGRGASPDSHSRALTVDGLDPGSTSTAPSGNVGNNNSAGGISSATARANNSATSSFPVPNVAFNLRNSNAVNGITEGFGALGKVYEQLSSVERQIADAQAALWGHFSGGRSLMVRQQLPPQIKKLDVTDRSTGKTVVRYQLTVLAGENPLTGKRQQVRRRYTTEKQARGRAI